MSIKIVPFTPGSLIKSSEANGHNNLFLNNIAQTQMEQLIDRNVIRSNDKVSPFVESYTSASGRKGSVDTAETTAIFSTNKYSPSFLNEASEDTTHDPNSFNNPESAFDEDESTFASKNSGTSSMTTHLGKTFSNKNVQFVKIVYDMTGQNLGSTTSPHTIHLQTFDGSDWSNFTLLAQSDNGNTFISKRTSVVMLDSSVQGVRVRYQYNRIDAFGNQATARLYYLGYGNTHTGEITHTIPSGTFNDTVSSGVVAVKIVDWEDGASLQWKATNATEDTGWKDFNISGDTAYAKVSEFTAFTAEPDEFIVKLIPKSVSPSPGKPSVSGSGIKLL